MIVSLFSWEAYQFGQGVANHGGLGAYLDARAKVGELERAVALIEDLYVDGEAVDAKALMEKALGAVASDLDPYSAYLSWDDLSRLRAETDQKFGGIGIQVEMRDERLTVVAPIDGTPGSKAGLLRGDRIVAVDGKSTEGQGLEAAISQMRGVPGSSVRLSVYRPRSDETFDVEVTRAVIAVQNVKGAKLLEGGIGYLRILQFGGSTAEEMLKAIDQLLAQGMTGLILDLRNNPGGLLEEAVEVVQPFVKSGSLVVYTEGRTYDQTERWEASGSGPKFDFPLALLVNSGSASAAEIVAGALKDLNRAILVGEKTFGKGSVQSVIQLGPRSGLRLTTARYYTPGGYVIHEKGIEPTIAVETDVEEDRKLAIQGSRLELMSTEEFVDQFEFEPIEDRQLRAALDALGGR